MSDTPNNQSDEARLQAEEALVDAALHATLGGEEPTDQRQAILARAMDEKPMPASTEDTLVKKSELKRYRVLELAIVCSCMGVVSVLLLPEVSSVRSSHRLTDRESTLPTSIEDKLDESEREGFGRRYQPNDAKPPTEKEPEALTTGGESASGVISKSKELSPITVDLDEPFRQGSFDVQVPKSGRVAGNGSEPVPAQSSPASKLGRNIETQNAISSRQSINQPLAATPQISLDRASYGVRVIQGGPAASEMQEPLSESLSTVPNDRYAFDQEVEPKRRRNIRERSGGDQYAPIYENPFIQPKGEEALSTFSIDVDTASYANTRQFLLQSNRLPPPNAVRIEELVNYFDYDYEGPEVDSQTPFAANMEVATCPWQSKHRLVRIAIKGREVEQEKRPLSNLVFLVDVSGSMNQPNKLPLVVRGLKQLARRLGENDRVAIVVYASSEGLALDSTPGSEQQTILSALDRLAAGGSTAGGAGIQLAYKIAEENFIQGGTNRVLLCTDGDFNVGLSNTEALGDMVETKAKESGVFLSVLGFGRGNLNDAMLEKITNRGNGNYSYIDSNAEARKVLVDQMTSTLVTIAKDVKIQVEFNPAKVNSYRLIGYENRVMANEDFNDDTKDAGEIGAGHTVTAFYEVVPTGVALPENVDPLKYQPTETRKPNASVSGKGPGGGEDELPTSDELLTLKLRYKQPTEDESSKLEFILTDEGKSLDRATQEFRFASSVAQFGLLLRNSEHRGKATYESVAKTAESSLGNDKHGYREEFLDMVDVAKKLTSGE